MTPSLITTACPACQHRWDFPDPTPAGADPLHWSVYSDPLEEVVCPCCGWEFAVEDEDGSVLDDGDLDSEGPFHVDDEGELSAENLLTVRCPFCTRAVEVTEGDWLRCPGCRHTFQVEGGRALRPGSYLHPEGIDPGDEDDLYHLYDAETTCPCCDEGYWDEEGFVTSLVATLDGHVQCTHCGEAFEDPELHAELAHGQGGLPNPRNLPTLRVAADGSGEYTSLARAHQLIRYEGGRIRLGPGRYADNLDSYGERLVLAADGPAEAVVLPGKLRFHGSRVVLRGLILTGEVVAIQGRVTLIDCVLRGARLAARGCRADLRLRRCRVELAPAAGVHATGGASLRLTDCIVTESGGAGVLVTRGAWARLRGCRVEDNRGDGARAEQGSTLFLHRCAVARNAGRGVALRGGRAILRDCGLSGQRRAGVEAGARARLVLLGCQVSGGESVGVRLCDVRAVVCDTAVRGQEGRGMVVGGRARVAVRRCEITGNGAGVRLGRSAGASVRALRCEGNRSADWDVAPGGMVRAIPGG